MPQLTISEVARQIRLRPSAIRYYEGIGLLPRAERLSGQRRYDASVLYRLVIIQRARQLGFSLSEIRQLFFGFRDLTRPPVRWRKLSQRKLVELDPRNSCYFFVRPKKSFLEVCVFLGRTLKAPQVRRADPASKSKVFHIIHIRHRDEVEAPITDWLREAYESSDVLTSKASTARAKSGKKS